MSTLDHYPTITSTANPTVRALRELQKRSDRDERGLFLIEGYRAVTRALEVGYHLEELYFAPEWFLGENEPDVIEQAAATGTRIIRLGKDALAKIAYRDRPEGLIAVGKQWHTSLTELNLPANPFLIVIEAIEKPGNLGTILRSADATGADAVIICDGVTDLFNPNVVRASTGVMFKVPTVVTSTPDTINFLHKRHIQSVGAIVQAAHNYTDVDYRPATAIVMGSEQFGLSQTWQKACNRPVRLPMLGLADSLNVSAATVVLAYEVVRQRQLLS
ncbi:MAG TPA: RNA methyltransferase [Candidatus Saccharimonadia bacterium]